jgi:hypothetical protein
MKIRFTKITPFTERWRGCNEVADELEAHAVECYEIANRHRDLIKQQYQALAQQSLILAAQRIRMV